MRMLRMKFLCFERTLSLKGLNILIALSILIALNILIIQLAMRPNVSFQCFLMTRLEKLGSIQLKITKIFFLVPLGDLGIMQEWFHIL
jgi:hypothetical protein